MKFGPSSTILTTHNEVYVMRLIVNGGHFEKNGRHIFHMANLECLHIQKCSEYINLHVCQFWCF